MKYTEEEMHELEILAHLEEKDFDHNTCDNSFINLVMNAGKKAFEIINKQKNEIERLLKDNYRLDRENQLKFEKAVDTSDYVSKEVIREKIEEIQNELDEKYSAEKLSIFSGNTYMEKFKLLGKLYGLKDLLGDE